MTVWSLGPTQVGTPALDEFHVIVVVCDGFGAVIMCLNFLFGRPPEQGVPLSLVKRTGALLVAVFLTLSLLAPQTARADSTTEKSITNASTWIADAWKTKPKQFVSAGTTADGIIALSAADQKPDTVRAMLLDLKKRGPSYSANYPAGLAKMVMTADIAGQNPRTLFGCERDLVAELKAMVQERPAKTREYWGPYLIAIALTRTGEQVPAWVIADMEKNQDTATGGFGYFDNNGAFIGDPDYTAVGISAMNSVAKNPKNASDQARANTSIGKATTWSTTAANQMTDAAGNRYWQGDSPANSTGMLASALGEVGVEITSPVRYLTSTQQTDGGWLASANGTTSNVMATTQAVLGVIGEGYGTARSTQVPEMVKCGTTTPPETVYNSPGDRVVNGRNWRTTCEPYSQTTRCRALIEATTVSQVRGRFVVTNAYVFNNMTYLPSPRSLWKTNPLGGNGVFKADVRWTAADGRAWRTECDTPLTGRGGCRSFAEASVIETITRPGQSTQYKWTTKEIFNSMVQFS